MYEKICLIGGTGRSGTSILAHIFSRHPAVSNISESRFFTDPDGILDFYSTCEVWSPHHYDVKVYRLEHLLKNTVVRHPFYKAFILWRRTGLFRKLLWSVRPPYFNIGMSEYCPDFIRHTDTLIEQLTEFRYQGNWIGMEQQHEMRYGNLPEKKSLAEILRNFLCQVIQSVCEHQQTQYCLEKTPWNILWFDKILELLPEAKLVHIYRDPRDVVASYRQHAWMPTESEKSAKIYKDLIERWWNIRAGIPPQSFLEISLESLVESPQDILREICSFWELPWHDTLLEIPLTKAHSGRWQKDLTAAEQQTVETILQPQLESMGYV
ncbi:hypothetical protein GF339_00045 [candidate division KSB3 bacterium]|uniref:Sulfotransferase n=1 Tax=candidate division KSB3 bacterium TaxID=2044937 RepID=A0A9D5JS19_9BACT|nr:hypothetical protein [candidate division KSB3 bacterium]